MAAVRGDYRPIGNLPGARYKAERSQRKAASERETVLEGLGGDGGGWELEAESGAVEVLDEDLVSRHGQARVRVRVSFPFLVARRVRARES